MKALKAFLILENGNVFEGESRGSQKEVISELVFNTSMTGYLEVLTDPSYAGQAVCMTYPLIGNYGICLDDEEADRPWTDGFIVHELSRVDSNFRSGGSLEDYLKKHDIPCVAGIDTRALTKILRESGTMNAMITTNENYDLNEIIPRLKAYTTGKVVEKVSCKEYYDVPAVKDLKENGVLAGQTTTQASIIKKPETIERVPSRIKALTGAGLKVAILDVGMKKDIALNLAMRGCDVRVFPESTKAEEILSYDPDGIMISNGPGDPKECDGVIKELSKLYESDKAIFAICLGHQLMALATGADTHKMKYGHRGANHPVKDKLTGRVYISSQNHGYVVDENTVDPAVAESAFINVNDGTNEGLKYKNKRIFTVQFHPEACGGPLDSAYLFERFISMMKGEEK
ncbi:MAG: carbamoyl phosphate synthase small subunit [Lachnospiraceae bacterium]|nr:carbamoyl phosphate synthase small subunit [Lachnospiraceae bacterium]